MSDTLFDMNRIIELIQRIEWTPDQLLEHRTARLRDLLAHAKTHSTWYGRVLADLDPATAELSDLPSLPVLTKQDLMENWDDIVTVPGLTLAHCQRHLAGLPDKPEFEDFLLDGRIVSSTGGTSGRQAVVVRDRAEWVDTFFTFPRWSMRAGMRAGNTSVGELKAATIIGDNPRHIGTAWSKAMDLHLVPVSLPIDQQCQRLNELQPGILSGYSSGIARIAEAQVRGSCQIDPIVISSSGEQLTPDFRACMAAAWPNARIQEGYGCTECGAMAASTGGDEALYVNDDFFVLEGLDRAYQPVSAGKTSYCVAVTSLEARALPLIRYELQDRMTVSTRPDPEGLAHTMIEPIGGRTSDWLVWGEVEVHPYAFTTPLTDDPAIELYQVQQRETGAHILIVPSGQGDLNEARLIGEITAGLKTAGAPSHITLEMVSSIQRVGDGQKHRLVVPL